MSDRKSISPFSVIAAALALPAGWIAYSTFGIDHHLPLPDAIEAERRIFHAPGTGLLSYYVDRSATGRPLVLIHSINAAGSAYEMRPLFEQYRAVRPVYALDLPGFGFSERSDRAYSPLLYTQAILDFLTTEIDQPADVVVLSLTSEFAAHAALARPDRFHSLTMISPTGFTASEHKVASQAAEQNGLSNLLYNAFAFPLWGQAFYDLLATQRSIHYFLQMNFQGEVDTGLENYSYTTTHQPGARHAPLYFVSGKLFTADIFDRVYMQLENPTLVIYDRDPNVRFDRLEEILQKGQDWNVQRIAPTMGLPQFEQTTQTVRTLDAFWGRLDSLDAANDPDRKQGWSALDIL